MNHDHVEMKERELYQRYLYLEQLKTQLKKQRELFDQEELQKKEIFVMTEHPMQKMMMKEERIIDENIEKLKERKELLSLSSIATLASIPIVFYYPFMILGSLSLMTFDLLILRSYFKEKKKIVSNNQKSYNKISFYQEQLRKSNDPFIEMKRQYSPYYDDQITSLEKRRKEIEMLQREIQHTLQLLQEPITNEKIAKVDIMFEQLEREKTLFKDYKGNK